MPVCRGRVSRDLVNKLCTDQVGAGGHVGGAARAQDLFLVKLAIRILPLPLLVAAATNAARART